MAIATRLLYFGLSLNLSTRTADSAAKKRSKTRNPRSLSFSTSLYRPSPWQAQISKNLSQALKSGNVRVCRAAGDIKRKRSGSGKRSGDGATGLSGFSEGRDEDASRVVCPGCGVFMQDRRPDAPGFFVRPANVDKKEAELDTVDFLEEMEDDDEEDEEEKEDEIEWDWKPPIVDEDEEWRKNLDGFALAGPGYGNVTEENIQRNLLKKKRKMKLEEPEIEKEMVVVCARCHSLRHYGQVKDQNAERLLPDFDFDRIVGSRVTKSTGSNRSVVVMVVDTVDFDGSFPRRAVKFLLEALDGRESRAFMEGGSRNAPRVVLVATKIDLLPQQISPARLDKWVRQRARSGGAPKLSGVFLVSAHKDLGVRNLASYIKELAGPRGNVWVIGAQNAGKSTLINAIVKRERGKVTHLTEAPFPGTTLGVVRIGGILPAKAKLYDTPGLLHPYQIFTRLNREEQKLVQIRKELKPRTYRMKVGQAVHVGGLMRLDMNEASIETIYVTVWSSVHLPLHLGKVENANEIKEKHFGVRLQPPIGAERVSELGEWKRREIKVSGNSWDINVTDVAAAGLGWFSVCLKGEATLSVWTYDGVDITIREALVLDRAHFLERPGFSLSKVVSEAISNKAKLKSNDSGERESPESKEKKNDDSRMFAEVIH